MHLYLEEKHRQIVQRILSKYDFSFFAFGSRVTGKHKKFSDLDIFYVEEIDNKSILRLEEEFEESNLPFKVDIINFHKCEKSFQEVLNSNYICLQLSTKMIDDYNR